MTNNLTLLYVEDEEIARESFTEILSLYFKNVIVTDNGKTALEIYNTNKIDIAILDISIPEINGLNVAKKIREQDQDIEIIMLTAFSDKDKLLQAINLQLFSYLIKPVKQNELDSTLNKVIDKLSHGTQINLKHGYNWDENLELLSYNDIDIKISKNEKALIKFLLVSSNLHSTACHIALAILNQENKKDLTCNNIVQLISRFKKKMLSQYNKEHFFIDNVYGLGYKISS